VGNFVLLGLLVLVLLVLVIVGATSDGASSDTKGLLPILQDQGISALSVALLALVTWIGFRLRFRGARSRYLLRYRPGGSEDPDATDEASEEHPLVREVLRQSLVLNPPRSLLVVTEPGSHTAALDAAFPQWVADNGRVPVVVDVSHSDATASIPMLSRACFVSRLAGSYGDEGRAHQLFTQQARRGKVVVVVEGLGHVVEAKARAVRRQAVEALIRSCLDEELPFVATVPEELSPSTSLVAAVRIAGRAGRSRVDKHLCDSLTRQGVIVSAELATALEAEFAGVRVDADDWQLDLAADLLVARLRAGRPAGRAVRGLLTSSDRGAFLALLSERALECDADHAVADDSAVGRSLGRIGVYAHYREDLTVPRADVGHGLSPDEDLDFDGAVSTLARRQVLSVVGEVGGDGLRFRHPTWLMFAGALGLGLDEARWAELLRPGVPQTTVRSLAAALVLHRQPLYDGGTSFVTTLSRLKRGSLRDVSLDMITAVVEAVQSLGQEPALGSEELAALRRAWEVATDEARLLFVRTIGPTQAAARFLWTQLVPPRFELTSYRLRRAISGRLAEMSREAWRELADEWRGIGAAGPADLSARGRLLGGDWQRVGLPLASLAWTLPSFVERLDAGAREESLALLRTLRETVAPAAGSASPVTGAPAPDPGLEISLAEGYKLAGAIEPSPDRTGAPAWWEEARLLFDQSTSWVSRQALHQAFVLASPGELPPLLIPGRPQHPFVTEGVALGLRQLQHDGAVVQDIWRNDVEALHDGGLDLSEQTHRLLGLSTLLINMAEFAHARAVRSQRDAPSGPPRPEALAGVDARERALVSTQLPRCFVSRGHTATMLDVPCDCSFGLCGRDVRLTVGDRKISAAFSQRATATAGAVRAAGHRARFVRGQFARVWARGTVTGEGEER
jgi:hypothetical protein